MVHGARRALVAVCMDVSWVAAPRPLRNSSQRAVNISREIRSISRIATSANSCERIERATCSGCGATADRYGGLRGHRNEGTRNRTWLVANRSETLRQRLPAPCKGFVLCNDTAACLEGCHTKARAPIAYTQKRQDVGNAEIAMDELGALQVEESDLSHVCSDTLKQRKARPTSAAQLDSTGLPCVYCNDIAERFPGYGCAYEVLDASGAVDYTFCL